MSAAFSGYDRTARIWDAQSGKEIAVLKRHAGIVWSAAFSDDGTRVVTASDDFSAPVWHVRTWDVTWATLVRGDTLRERICTEKLIGAAQEFTDDEMDDPILRGIEPWTVRWTRSCQDKRDIDAKRLHARAKLGAAARPCILQLTVVACLHSEEERHSGDKSCDRDGPEANRKAALLYRDGLWHEDRLRHRAKARSR